MLKRDKIYISGQLADWLTDWLGRVWSEQAVIITPGDAGLDCLSVLALMRARGFIVDLSSALTG